MKRWMNAWSNATRFNFAFVIKRMNHKTFINRSRCFTDGTELNTMTILLCNLAYIPEVFMTDRLYIESSKLQVITKGYHRLHNRIELRYWIKNGYYNESGLPSHALIHLISNSYQQPTYWAPPSFYPNLETYAPTYVRTLSHDGIIIMPGYHRVGFPGKSYYGTAQNQEIIYQHKSTILIP